MSLLMDSLANATPVLKLRIETPVKFSSGNQMEMGKGRLFRSQSYHEYHNYLKAQLDDIYDDLEFKPNDGCAYFLRTMFTYPIPKSYVTSKKAKLEFDSTKILPITRSTIDLDNSEKGTNDVLQEVFGFDDSQIVSKESHKRYWLGDTYVLGIELYEMSSGVEIEFYE